MIIVCQTLVVLWQQYRLGVLQQGGDGGLGDMSPPTLKSMEPHVLVPPNFYHTIYFDWLVTPTYKIVPTPLLQAHFTLAFCQLDHLIERVL